MALEALKSNNLEKVSESNYAAVLNLIAVEYTKDRKALVRDIIQKFNVAPSLILALFDRSIAAEFLPDAQIRKAGKARQDLLYKQVRYSASHENPIAFAELLACLTAPGGDWPAIQKLIGLYSLDPQSVLATLFDIFTAAAQATASRFTTIFQQGPWTKENLIAVISWRLWHTSDWRPTLRCATALIPLVLSFDDIYSLLGTDSKYTAKIQNHWEDELAKKAGASQFSALASAGALDGATAQKGPEISHLEHRQYFVQYLLEQNKEREAYRIINNFPLIAQMNENIAATILNNLLAESPNLLNNTDTLTLVGALIGQSAPLMDLLCEQIQNLPHKEALEAFRQYILPAISLISNRETITKIWQVMAGFSQNERYELYTEWQFSVPRYHKPVKYAILKAERSTKGILKRVSNENATKMLALFAQQAIFNPYTAFSVFLSQVEAYDKIGSLMLEQLSDLTDMAWDVLPLTVLVQLSSGRTQQQGLFDSKWIQALSSFIARLAAKAPKFDTSKLIIFVLKQFHQGNFDNLLIFKDLFYHMGGCMQLNELSTTHLELMSSHKAVREITLRQLGAPQPSKETIERILGALKDNDLVLELFVALCYGYRNALPQGPTPDIGTPKLLSHRLDDFTLIIQQYSSLLAKLAFEEFTLLVDPIPVLLEKYGIPAAMAMDLWRPFIFENISKDDYDAESYELHPQLASIVQALPPISSAFSREFYLTAWTLETFEIQKFERVYSDGEAGLSHAVKLGSKIHSHTLKKTDQRLKINQTNWFSKPGADAGGLSRRECQLQILTKVILPRALYSSTDALFCALFINKLCRLGTPYFSYMSFLDTLFNEKLIYNTMCSCTPYEAENLGIFIDTIFYWLLIHCTPPHFKTLSTSGHVNGELTTSAALLRQRDSNPGTREKNIDATFSRREIFAASEKWQLQLGRALKHALSSKEYMVLRNAITLIKVGQNEIFRQTGDAAKIQKQVREIATKDPRADIKLAATALVGQLAKAVKMKRALFQHDEYSRSHRSTRESIESVSATPRTSDKVVIQSRESSIAPPKVSLPDPPLDRAPPTGAVAMDMINQRLKRDRDSTVRGSSRTRENSPREDRAARDDRDRRYRRDREREREVWDDRDSRDRNDRDSSSGHDNRDNRDRDGRDQGRGRSGRGSNGRNGRNRDRNDRDRNDRDRNDRDRNDRDRDRNGRNRDRNDRDRNDRERRERERRELPLPPPAGLPPRRDYNRNW